MLNSLVALIDHLLSRNVSVPRSLVINRSIACVLIVILTIWKFVNTNG